jgi:hypothetical protein
MNVAERIGAVLVAPRRAMRAAAEHARGASDVGWLIAARLVAGETPRLVHALARAQVSPGAALQALLATASVVLPDVIGVLVASVVMGLFAPRRASAIGVAAYAWVPYFAVELVAALAFTAAGRVPTGRERIAITVVAVAWALVVWVVGVLALRASPEVRE